ECRWGCSARRRRGAARGGGAPSRRAPGSPWRRAYTTACGEEGRVGADPDPSSPRRAAFSLRSNGNRTPVPYGGTPAGRIVGQVSGKHIRNGSPTVQVSGPLALQLSPGRAFVLHLDARAELPHRLLGRVEHVTSGRIARISSL